MTVAYLISRDDFEQLDELDDNQDKQLQLRYITELSHSYVLEHTSFTSSSVETKIAEVGDFDGEAKPRYQSDMPPKSAFTTPSLKI